MKTAARLMFGLIALAGIMIAVSGAPFVGIWMLAVGLMGHAVFQ